MSIKAIQKLTGAIPDGIFGPNTCKRIRDFFGLTNIHAAHFLGQCSHETMHFKVFEENLNYSKEGLLKVFGKYFDEGKAELYQRNPEKIANLVYANRMGNGNEFSGDGWRYRGRGAIQLTGKTNYILFSHYIKDPEVVIDPDKVLTHYLLESAIWFFHKNNVFDKVTGVDESSIKAVTRIINGGYNGIEERIVLTKKYYSWIS